MPSRVVLGPVGGYARTCVAASRAKPQRTIDTFVCKACDTKTETAGALVDHIRCCAKAAEVCASLLELAKRLAVPLGQSSLAQATAERSSWMEFHGVVIVATYMEVDLVDLRDHADTFAAVVKWAREHSITDEVEDGRVWTDAWYDYKERVYENDPAIRIILGHGDYCHDQANAWMVAYLLQHVGCDADVFEKQGSLDFAVTSACFGYTTKR